VSAPQSAAAPVAASAAVPEPKSVAPAASAAAVAPRRRVTHTKVPEPAEAAPVAAPVAASAAATTQAPIQKEMNPSSCPPGVAALGLCISK
jgi:hypothetical protein